MVICCVGVGVGVGVPASPPLPTMALFGVGVVEPVGTCGPANGVAVGVGVTAGVDLTVAGGVGVVASTADLPFPCVAL